MLFPYFIFQVEELMNENKEAEEEISRWRAACEMEVEAGKKAIKENKELVGLLDQSFHFYSSTCVVPTLLLSQVVDRFYLAIIQ